MGGIPGRVGEPRWWLMLTRLVSSSKALSDTRWRRDVIGLDHGPHWLYRDMEADSGRATRQEMRRPSKWQDIGRP